jgi:hypothetical protein
MPSENNHVELGPNSSGPHHVSCPKRSAIFARVTTMTRFTNPTKPAVSLVKAATGLLSVSLSVSRYVF